MKKYTILYHRYQSRPQSYDTQAASKESALAVADVAIHLDQPSFNCYPIAIVDWNEGTVERIGYNLGRALVILAENFTSSKNGRFQFFYKFPESHEDGRIIPYHASDRYDNGSMDAAVEYMDDPRFGMKSSLSFEVPDPQPICVFDYRDYEVRHVARDFGGKLRQLTKYPDEAVGEYTTSHTL